LTRRRTTHPLSLHDALPISYDLHAHLWTSATPALVLRAVYEAATGILNSSDLSRIEERRTRLQQRKVQMNAKADELGLASLKAPDRKSTRLNSSHEWISYAV